MWTAEFDRFVAPARMRPQVWRIAVVLLGTLALYAAGVVAVLVATLVLSDGDPGTAMMRLAAAERPRDVIALLATFAGMFAGPLLLARWLHGRPARSLLGPRLAAGFAVAFLVASAVYAVSGVLLPGAYDVVANMDVRTWLAFLPLAVAGLLLQTGAEEVVFRGYLQGQLAARFESPWVWMLLPALLFASLHYDPATAGANAPILVGSALLFGLIAADLTRVTGGIGAAWGLHFANNASAILVVALDGSISGLALWRTPFDAADVDTLRPLVAQELLLSAIVWLCIRLWLARRDPGKRWSR